MQCLGICSGYTSCSEEILTTDLLQSYIDTGIFMTKYEWKRRVRSKVNDYNANNIRCQISHSDSLNTFGLIQTTHSPCKFWTASGTNRSFLSPCRSAVKLLGKLFSMPYSVVCTKCGISTNHFVIHILYDCSESAHLNAQSGETLA